MHGVDLREAEKLPNGGELFFCIFSRSEFALKEAGYLKQQNRRISADWDRFCDEYLTEAFFETMRDCGDCDTLLYRPPSKQIEDGGHLGWRPMPAPRDTKALMLAIRRVRNNLFHGGKSGDEDHDRNEQLIAESIFVLIEAIKRNQETLAFFEGRY